VSHTQTPDVAYWSYDRRIISSVNRPLTNIQGILCHFLGEDDSQMVVAGVGANNLGFGVAHKQGKYQQYIYKTKY
jgi:hypothetical protein